MSITKQQAQQELLRRKSLVPSNVKVAAPAIKTPAPQALIAQSARAELARRELVKRGQMQQKPTGFSGLANNFKSDFGSFAKGMVGLGKQALTHPLDTTEKIAGVGYEAAKLIPDALKSTAHDIANFGETQRKGIEAFKQLRQIPLGQQKEMLASDIKQMGETKLAKENPNLRRLAQTGLGLLGNFSQYSRPGEKIYNEPFSFALDAIPVANAVGATSKIAKVASVANKIPAVAKTTEALSDAFVPMGKLKRLGYPDVAESVQNSTYAARKAQEGIIKSTVKKFDKDFKLSQPERVEFFDTIDAGRRDASYVPKSANPKIQQAIDWYMNKELPAIRKTAGYEPTKQNPLIQEARRYKTEDEFIKAQGEPVYHGTTAKFDKFSLDNVGKATDSGMFGKGVYFSSDAKEAATYANRNGINGEVKESFHGLKNPYVINSKSDIPKIEVPNRTIEDMKNADKNYSEAFTKYLQSKGYDGVVDNMSKNKQYVVFNPEQIKTKSQLSEIYKQALEAGNNAPIENYLHHFFNPTKEVGFGNKLSSPKRGFLKQSTDAQGFVKDPVVSIAGVKSKAAVANIKDDFIKGVIAKHGRSAEGVTEFKNGKILAADGEELAKYKGGYLPKDLAEELTRIEKGEPGWLKTVLAPMRTFNRNWKPLATAARPRYHLRNIIGNVYNASFVGGAKLRNYPEAALQQMKLHIGTQMKEGTIAGKMYSSLFKTPPEASMIKKAMQDGVIGNGFFGVDINDIADVAESVEDFSKVIAKMENPSFIQSIPGIKQWINTMQTFGSAIEDNARLSLYMDQIKKGATRVEAKAYVNKHLFDYMNGLGEADQVIKAFIPFWSWRRFNVPLQTGAVIKNPLRHLMVQEGSKPIVQQQEENNPEYKYLSQREKDMGAFKVGEENVNGKISDKYIRTQGVLPIQDLGGLGDPDNIGFTPLAGMLAQAYNTVLPPEDPQQNLDYFGRPVEQFPGESKRYLNVPMRGTVKEIMNAIPAFSEANKAIGGSYAPEDRPSLEARMETTFSPFSQTIQDREKNKQYFESDFNRKYGTGTMSHGYLTEYKNIVKKIIEKPEDQILSKNLKTLAGLLMQGGMTNEQLQKEALLAIQAKLKKENPKEKRPSQLRPQRPSPLLDQYYAGDVRRKAQYLQPYFR